MDHLSTASWVSDCPSVQRGSCWSLDFPFKAKGSFCLLYRDNKRWNTMWRIRLGFYEKDSQEIFALRQSRILPNSTSPCNHPTTTAVFQSPLSLWANDCSLLQRLNGSIPVSLLPVPPQGYPNLKGQTSCGSVGKKSRQG